MQRRLFAECFGTFALVFAGTGALVIDDVTGGAVTHVGVGLTFGLVVMAMIYAVGGVSGAHLNPAVSIGFWSARRLPTRAMLSYVASQCTGAFVASLLLRGMFPTHPTLGATLPAGDPAQSFVLEVVLALILMFVILSVSHGGTAQAAMAGAAVGATVALEALFAGPISGASMNPARSLAPALVTGHVEHLWVYLVAPVVGAAAAVRSCRAIHGASCCPLSCAPQPAS